MREDDILPYKERSRLFDPNVANPLVFMLNCQKPNRNFI